MTTNPHSCCRRWRKALFQLTSLITSQLCGVVWHSLCLIVCVCVCCLCNCSSQSVNLKTQQNDKWGQGTKLLFLLGWIIGMKSSPQFNTETEHFTGCTVHLIIKGKQLPYCGQLGALTVMQVCYQRITDTQTIMIGSGCFKRKRFLNANYMAMFCYITRNLIRSYFTTNTENGALHSK